MIDHWTVVVCMPLDITFTKPPSMQLDVKTSHSQLLSSLEFRSLVSVWSKICGIAWSSQNSWHWWAVCRCPIVLSLLDSFTWLMIECSYWIRFILCFVDWTLMSNVVHFWVGAMLLLIGIDWLVAWLVLEHKSTELGCCQCSQPLLVQ